jgi:predicted NBD/HSP70 family sugar kinase
MKASGKATHEGIRRHNLHLLLSAVYSGQADNRAALAQSTGLAKPTVSELVGELMRLGLLTEDGIGQSTESGGKRPRLLRFVPEARQVVGVAVETDQISAVLANLDGEIVAWHSAALNGAQGDEALICLQEAINGLVAQLDAPLLCLGVGVPGTVDEDSGIVRESPLLGWHHLPLADQLADHYEVPAYVANSTELTAIAQRTFSRDRDARNLVTILIDHNLEVGIAFGGPDYHQGSDIGGLRVLSPDGQPQLLEKLLTLPALRQRAATLARDAGAVPALGERWAYLELRRALLMNHPVAEALYDETARHIATVCAWVIALLRPDEIALAGPIIDLGEPLLSRVEQITRTLFQSAAVERVTFELAESGSLSALGAVAHALRQELGIQA